MTLQEALAACDRMKPNACSETDKRRWLSDLDGLIDHEILAAHEGSPAPFSGYDDATPGDTVLLVPEPYADVYIKYLFAQIDFVNAEFARYNNSAAMYNTALSAYANFYRRTHLPLQPNRLKAR